jgi:hypothetical protein
MDTMLSSLEKKRKRKEWRTEKHLKKDPDEQIYLKTASICNRDRHGHGAFDGGTISRDIVQKTKTKTKAKKSKDEWRRLGPEYLNRTGVEFPIVKSTQSCLHLSLKGI